jgi:hypothetical protein
LSLVSAVFLYQVWIGQRSGVIGVGLAMLAAYYIPRKRLPRLAVCAGLFLIIFALVGFIGKFRGELHTGSNFQEMTKFKESGPSQKAKEIYEGVAYAGLNEDSIQLVGMYYAYLKVIPSRVGYDFGYEYLRYTVIWIPRLLWPERPDYRAWKAEELKNAAGVNHTSGPVATMLGMYYLNFGMVGIIGGCFITGLLLGTLERWRRLYPDNHGVLLAFVFLHRVGWGWVIIHGFLGQLEGFLPWTLTPLIIAFIYLKWKFPQQKIKGRVSHKWQRVKA